MLAPESESSDISRLSKIRTLKIKPFGEIGCLFLVDYDDQTSADSINVLDLIKDLAGSIPSML